MEELPIPSDEVEKFYCDLYSISERLTHATNRYKALYEITQELESPSLKERIARAASLRALFIDIETKILQLMERLNALLCPPKYNIFTGELEQETASENRINPATTDAILRNDLLDETRYYIRLLDDKIEAELALSPEFKINNATLQSLRENNPKTLSKEIFKLKDIGWNNKFLFIKCLCTLANESYIINSIDSISEILSLSQKIELKNNETAELIGLLDAFGEVGCTLKIKEHPTMNSFVRDIKKIFTCGGQKTIENNISSFLNEVKKRKDAKNEKDVKKIFREKVKKISLKYQTLFKNDDE